MDRELAFPTFDPRWIAFEDEDIVVVDKPAAVPTQSADPARPDDIVSRLRAFLVARGDVDPYLGVHQRLDRDTSGLLVFARRREANASLASQFEGRTVRKRYAALVVSERPPRARVTLRDAIAPGDGGAMRVVSDGQGGKGPKAQEAVTHVRLVASRGDRHLLEVTLETGRTHQARVQLAHAGWPIAGDALYGGATAPRLLLHAERLELAHPFSGEPVAFVAPKPPEFDAFLEGGDIGDAVYAVEHEDAFHRALDRAFQRRYGLAHATSGERATSAFRVVNEAGDALPRLAVDVYGPFAVVQFYGDDGPWAEPAARDRVLDAIHRRGFDGVYVKVRPKQANVIVDAHREEFAPRAPARGEPAEDDLVIVEEGVEYLVRLGDGLSTGIFLDQRENRRRVRELAAGSNVLNLFSYTCAFSVAAAVGGAWRTVSVDASSAVLERGRACLARLGLLDAAEHTFVAEDAFVWLDRAARAARDGNLFDLVILDPPSYSTTKRTRFSAEQHYADLAAKALKVVRPGGRLLASTNHRGIARAKFRRMLRDAARLANVELAQVKDMPDPLDYPPPLGKESHLKSVLVTRARV
jgi:23S rRNA (cytosine1962-C5)-methyltransferase